MNIFSHPVVVNQEIIKSNTGQNNSLLVSLRSLPGFFNGLKGLTVNLPMLMVQSQLRGELWCRKVLRFRCI